MARAQDALTRSSESHSMGSSAISLTPRPLPPPRARFRLVDDGAVLVRFEPLQPPAGFKITR